MGVWCVSHGPDKRISCRSNLEANDELLESHPVGVGYIVPVLLLARFQEKAQGFAHPVPLEKGTEPKDLEFVLTAKVLVWCVVFVECTPAASMSRSEV